MKVANVAKACTDNASIQTDVSHAKHQYPIEQSVDTEEIIGMTPKNETLPNKFTAPTINHEEDLITSILEQEDTRVEKSCSTELTDKCILQLSTFKSRNDVCVESTSFSHNSRYPDGMMQGSDAAEEWNVGITHLKLQIGCELSIKRSEESDQTPLLYPEKTLTRSLSLGSRAKFSNSIMRAEYGEKLLECEVVAIEEKTNRMERSDYQISKIPSLGLLKTGENSESKSEIDSKTSPPKELCLTSPKESGKRQPRPSFFSSCICCTTAIR